MDILKKLPGNDGSYLKITRFLILAFVAECTFGGSGRWLEIGPLSIRMILFAACFVMTLPYVLRDIRRLAANLQVIVTVAYGVYLLVCAVIGIRTGNQMGFIWADISTMMTLALLPGFMAVMSEQSMINRAVDVLYWSAAVVAAITVAMHFILVVMNQKQFDALYELITGSYMGGIAELKTGMQRCLENGLRPGCKASGILGGERSDGNCLHPVLYQRFLAGSRCLCLPAAASGCSLLEEVYFHCRQNACGDHGVYCAFYGVLPWPCNAG